MCGKATSQADHGSWITSVEQKFYLRQALPALGSRELSKKLCEEGFTIGHYSTRTLMRKLGLVVQQSVKYKSI